MRGRKLGLCLADLSHDIMSFYLPVKYTHATILSNLLQKSNKEVEKLFLETNFKFCKLVAENDQEGNVQFMRKYVCEACENVQI